MMYTIHIEQYGRTMARKVTRLGVNLQNVADDLARSKKITGDFDVLILRNHDIVDHWISDVEVYKGGHLIDYWEVSK